MRRVLPLLFVLLLPAWASAQSTGTITGVVTDDTGEPLPGAQIVVVGTMLGAATGFDGAYRIAGVPEGEVTLRATFVGYSSEEAIVTVGAGGAVTQDFTLATDLLQLSDVVVTGVVNPVSKLESSVSITTLGPEQIEASAPRTTAEIFRTIPGIRSEASGGDGNTNITVRGVPISAGGSKYLQLQEDGLPIFLYGDIAFATADIFLRADPTLARIEAIRGGSASTLSSNSPAGIINFISKTGEVEGGSISTQTGLDYNSNRVGFEYGAPIGDDLAFHVGGFFRSGEGQRNTGYLAQQGGQVKANLTKLFDSGYARIYAKYLNDRTPAYLPMPIQVTGTNDDPNWESIDGFSATLDTPHSVFLQSNVGFGADGRERPLEPAGRGILRLHHDAPVGLGVAPQRAPAHGRQPADDLVGEVERRRGHQSPVGVDEAPLTFEQDRVARHRGGVVPAEGVAGGEQENEREEREEAGHQRTTVTETVREARAVRRRTR